MSKLYGIDLGTTFSAIGYLNDLSKPIIIPNDDGDSIMRSCVYFAGDSVIVGQSAYLAATEDPDRCVEFIKRFMEDEDYKVNIDGKEYTPAIISSFILKKLAQDAEIKLGEPVKDVVITIPANFADKARTATIEAGKLAGLNVVGLVNEPTAAAIFYATEHDISGRTLIFDLGGGTFDVTVADVHGTSVSVKASSGDRNLGGVDFDNALLKHFEEIYQKSENSALYDDDSMRNEILHYCEDIKRLLSKKSETAYTLKGTAGRVKGTITRDHFEELIASYIASIEMLIETVLEDSKDTKDSINDVILVGGSSRIPAVQEMLKRMFGKEPKLVGDVDQSVGLGGTIMAGLRMMEENADKVDSNIRAGLKDVKLDEVSNAFFGTSCLGHDEILEKNVLENSIIIKKGMSLPCSVTETYYTVREDQRHINVDITESELETKDLNNVNVIAEEKMELPPNLPNNEPIEVTFSYDKDQVMSAVFEHKSSGKRVVMKGNPKKGFNSEVSVNSNANLDDFNIE